MKKILAVLMFVFWRTFANAQAVQQPDTLRGVALVLTEGGRVTVDPNTGYAHISRGLVIQPEWVWCISTPVNMSSAQDVNQISVGFTTRFARIGDGEEIPADRVMMFKVMQNVDD